MASGPSPGPAGAFTEVGAAAASRFVTAAFSAAKDIAGRPQANWDASLGGQEDMARLMEQVLGDISDRAREGRLGTPYTRQEGIDLVSGLLRGAAMVAGSTLTLAEQFGISGITDFVKKAGTRSGTVETIPMGKVAAGEIARGSLVVENPHQSEVGPVRVVASSLLGPLGRANEDEPSYIAFQDVIFSPRSIPTMAPGAAELVRITFGVPRETRPGKYVGLIKTLPFSLATAHLEVEVINP